MNDDQTMNIQASSNPSEPPAWLGSEMAGTETNSSLPLSTIILATDDTALTIGIEEAVRSAGATLHLAATPTTLLELVDSRFPVLILLDLGLPGDWVAAIRRCKLRPSTRQTPIYILMMRQSMPGSSPRCAPAR
ncbi:MAG: response regulator transcription factor [Caldilineaceae bacterium]|nr:response regulator transcription factor [Caldilineaceae bacterium]